MAWGRPLLLAFLKMMFFLGSFFMPPLAWRWPCCEGPPSALPICDQGGAAGLGMAWHRLRWCHLSLYGMQ